MDSNLGSSGVFLAKISHSIWSAPTLESETILPTFRSKNSINVEIMSYNFCSYLPNWFFFLNSGNIISFSALKNYVATSICENWAFHITIFVSPANLGPNLSL